MLQEFVVVSTSTLAGMLAKMEAQTLDVFEMRKNEISNEWLDTHDYREVC